MRILLIYPQCPDTFWGFQHALRFVSKKAALPPLGLLTVAAMLPKAWEQRLVDMNVRPLVAEDLAWADYALISAMPLQRQAVQQVLARCHEAGLPVVAGGPLFSSEPERFPSIDHLVLNEGEITLPLFLHDLEAGHPQRVYTTTAYADLTRTPVPRWDLIDLRDYGMMGVQYSRGCPFNCEFCNVTALFGHNPRVKSAAQIIAELDRLYALGWRSEISFADDNLIANKRRFREDLLPALRAWRPRDRGITFQMEATINLADDEELLREMVAAGFDAVFVGIETPDERSLAECKKGQNRGRDLVACAKRLQRGGLMVQGGFIVGFDADTPAIFQRQIDFIQESGIVVAMVGLLQAPRGTLLFERMRREGRLLGGESGDNTDGWINFVPRMDRGTLLAGYRRILQEIYRPSAYYRRIRTFLEEYRRAPSRRRFTLAEIGAFVRSLYRLGIRGAGRRQYWRLICWTLLHRPGSFPTAVALTIYGIHFRRVLAGDRAEATPQPALASLPEPS